MLVEGVGWLDEYGSYMDTIWEKGIVYFLRDSLQRDIEMQLESGVDASRVRPLVEKLGRLNSELSVWESNGGRVA